MRISTAYLSEQGGREKNEDTVCIRRKDNKLCVFVGDGLGGYDNGKFASETAAQTIIKYSEQQDFLDETRMQEAAMLANEKIKEQQAVRNSNMKTTIVVLGIDDLKARWMHVGDSRLYHFKNGKIVGQTMDHSVSQMAVLMGEITQEQIRFHEDRNRVLRALGSDNSKPDISELTEISSEKEAFLLCTDGFWEYVFEEEMEEELRKAKSPEKWLKKMRGILAKRVPRGNDNYTAVAVFLEK